MQIQNDYGIFFSDENVFKQKEENSFIIPCRDVYQNSDHPLSERDFFYIGEYAKRKIFGVSYHLPEGEERFVLIRAQDALRMTDRETSQMISRAKQLLNWHRSSLYSGCCGVKTALSPTEIAKICTNCKRTIYATTLSFVIVLIEKDGKLLLVRSPHFEEGMYSTVGGFVDAGESYEDAVHREVEEEVGIKVKDVTYYGSQPWPFSSSMGVIFMAKYDSGEIRKDSMEIEDAKWFDPKELPLLPDPSSIARQIIDEYVDSI